jgi:electron transfer flavoprotein beta subunit
VNVVVCVKEVMRFTTFSAFDPAGGKLQEKGRVFMPNPCDESAVEAALSLRDESGKGQVTVVGLGPERAESSLRWCLAMGADRAVHLVSTAAPDMAPWTVARLLVLAISDMNFDLILTGRASLDRGSSQVGAFIAELMGLPLVSAVARIELNAAGTEATVERVLERGDRECMVCPVPAVFTADRVLGRPRYPTLAGRAAARTSVIAKRRPEASASMKAVMDEPLAMDRIGLAPPKIRPKKILAPDSGLSAADRIKFIMSGGMGKRDGSKVKGDPEKMARAIFEFLKENKFIASDKSRERMDGP